jgi:WhiB family redox-sensing transcriptional regulator
MSDVDQTDWIERGACNGMTETHGAELVSKLFFPTRGEGTRRAKEICAGCEVREECLEFAIVSGEKFGIWGGKSERERRSLRRQWAREQGVHLRGRQPLDEAS